MERRVNKPPTRREEKTYDCCLSPTVVLVDDKLVCKTCEEEWE